MATQKKPTAKLHYLETVSPRVRQKSQGIEHKLETLGKRLSSIEKEIQNSLQEMQKITEQKPGERNQVEVKLQKQVQELKQEFHAQMQEISQVLESGKPASTSSSPSLIDQGMNWLSSLRKLFSFRTSQKIFEDLWKEEFDPFGRDPAFEEKVKPFFDFLYSKYWRIRPHGLENVPSQGRGLLVSNHSGTLAYDGSMIRMAVSTEHPSKRDVRFLVEDFVYYLPFIGTCMYRLGGVRASRDNAEQLLNTDHLVAVFPEGVKGIGKYYSQRYHLQRFGRGGFIKLAIRTKSPIIPVAVIGAEEIHPILYKSSVLAKPFGIPYIPITPTLPLLGPLGLIPLPSKWEIYFGEPLDFSQYSEATLKDELKIHKLSEMVREKIQTMVTAGLKKRRGVFW